MLSTIFSASVLISLVHALGAIIDLTAVGPSTSLSAKSTVCNVLDYGAVANNSTDIGPAISSAFLKCASKGNSVLYIPPGSYSIATGVTLSGGSNWAMQIDGLITLTSDGRFGGNAFVIEKGSNIEVFSSNGLGAINGQGYITRLTGSSQNARLFRFISCSDISFHDIILVDSPTFHLVFNEVSNMETYHVTIRGPDIGGTDGIDLSCNDNCYLHDIEVTNRDECISVKSPSINVLIEDIFCNHSGGMSIGSLTADVTESANVNTVSNITMRNIQIFQNTQMLMIKTFPGGSGATGYVHNSLFENFWSYDTTYALDIDQYWESHTTPNTGAVALSSLTFSNWTGTMYNGAERGAIVIRGSDQVPATDITLEKIDMWTVNGDRVVNQCKNVYGTGYCAAQAVARERVTTFTTSVTSTVAPSGFTSPTSPVWGVSGYGTTVPIPVYTPAVFWGKSKSATNTAERSTKSVAPSTSASSSKQTLTHTSSTVSVAATTKSSTKSVAPSTAASTSVSAKKTSSSRVTPSTLRTISTSSAKSSRTSASTSVSAKQTSSSRVTPSTLRTISTSSAKSSRKSTSTSVSEKQTSSSRVTPSTLRTISTSSAKSSKRSASVSSPVPTSSTLRPIISTSSVKSSKRSASVSSPVDTSSSAKSFTTGASVAPSSSETHTERSHSPTRTSSHFHTHTSSHSHTSSHTHTHISTHTHIPESKTTSSAAPTPRADSSE